MKYTFSLLLGSIAILFVCSCNAPHVKQTRMHPSPDSTKEALAAHHTTEVITDNKLIIYQIFTRLFGNKMATNQHFGTKEENGSGKFNDVTDVALQELKKSGYSHVWYTGVIEHATMTDYTAYGIALDDADVVKGRGGSPYAIKDYYDVNPDLAVDVRHRMAEFEALVKRTHANELKVIIDFVPNHLARHYHSDAKPAGVEDFGAKDDVTKSFDPNNNFYYIPGKTFVVPKGGNPLGGEKGPKEDQHFTEFPAKVTGNDVFSAEPSINDWYETIKLNYGVDIQHNRTNHFHPIPSTWLKMRDILVFWTKKGVDGFRCDMAEMVPVEFWGWVIPEVQKVNPDIKFIAEIYNPQQYHNYIRQGKFDYLYDKVGLYDGLRRLMEGHGSTDHITFCWKDETRDISNHMLRFLENHDEQRIASKQFAGNPWTAVPAMTVSATLSAGPVMVYFGQEVGEPGKDNEGFSNEDGRTTIFDYWGVPEHQKWMNEGKFDGGKLSDEQKQLRGFYVRLLNICKSSEAIRKGHFLMLHDLNRGGRNHGYSDTLMYSYLRYTDKEKLLIVVNFDRHARKAVVKIPREAWAAMKLDAEATYRFTDILGEKAPISVSVATTLDANNPSAGVPIELPALGAAIFRIE